MVLARQVDKSKEIFISTKEELEYHLNDFRFTSPTFARVNSKIKNLPYFIGTVADKELYWSGDLEDLKKYYREISDKHIKEITAPETNYKTTTLLILLGYILGALTSYYIFYG